MSRDYYEWFLEQIEPFQARIKVSVSADDDMTNQIVSLVTRELRSLGDVLIVETKPDYILHVVALKTELKGGYPTGHAMSVVVGRLVSPQFPSSQESAASSEFMDKLKASTSRKQYEKFAWEAAERQALPLQHRLLVGADLRAQCETIVGDFDAEILQPLRQDSQALREMISEGKKKEALECLGKKEP